MPVKRSLLLIIASFMLFFGVPPSEPLADDASGRSFLSDRAQFNYAEFLLSDGDYIGAVREFERFISLFPGHPNISKAQFKVAESYIGAGNYAAAGDVFGMFLRNFPGDPLAAEAELMRWTLAREGAGVEDSTAGVRVIMPALKAGASPGAESAAAGTVAALMETVPLLETEKAALPPELPVPGREPGLSVKVEEVFLLMPPVPSAPAIIEEPVEVLLEDDLLATLYPAAPLPSDEAITRLPEQLTTEEKAGGSILEKIVADLKYNAPPLKEEMAGAVGKAPAAALPDIVEEEEGGPLRAVQVMYFNGRSMDEIEDEMEVLASSGINTIILRVFHNDGDTLYPHIEASGVDGVSPRAGVYFNSAHSPVISDMLAGITGRAHYHGLKVFAWMTTRYADYGVELRSDLACRGYDLSTGDIVRCKGLDVFNDAVVERLSAIYRELASYDIDGILFQDDLVLRHTEGFGPHAAEKYMKDTGRSLVPEALYSPKPEGVGVDYTPEFWKWASWKNKTLLGVAEELKRTVREVNPDIKFAINFMYEAVTNPGGGLAWLSQDLKKAREIGFDYYSIMAYHRQMGDELGKSRGEIKEIIADLVADAVDIVGEPEKVLIKFQTIDWKTGSLIPYGEVIGLVRSVRGVDEVSLAVVPYKLGFPFYELTLDNDLVFLK